MPMCLITMLLPVKALPWTGARISPSSFARVTDHTLVHLDSHISALNCLNEVNLNLSLVVNTSSIVPCYALLFLFLFKIEKFVEVVETFFLNCSLF